MATLENEGRLTEQFSQYVTDHLGLHFPPDRWGDLKRAAQAIARESGFKDTDSCMKWIMNSPESRERVELLASNLTIGETYFFRERYVIDILRNEFLPELIKSRQKLNRHIRIWSAGCSSGEEPYTIAILLKQLIPDLSSWNISILATDLNVKALKKASEGRYREWSFRDTPDEIKNRYFEKVGQNSYEISPEIRRMVQFSYLNLAEDAYPSLLNHTTSIDLLLCRNVLMYFSNELSNSCIRKFERALSEDGWLIVAAPEVPYVEAPNLTPVSFTEAILFKKTGANFTAKKEEAVEIQAEEPDFSQLKEVYSGSERPIEEVKEMEVDPELQVRSYANEGQLEKARRLCLSLIEKDKLNVSYHYLLASILQEQGRVEESIASLNRVLFLDHSFVLAHFSLGNLNQKLGKYNRASRHYSNARSLLSKLPPDAILPDSEGITAGRLREVIQAITGIDE